MALARLFAEKYIYFIIFTHQKSCTTSLARAYEINVVRWCCDIFFIYRMRCRAVRVKTRVGCEKGREYNFSSFNPRNERHTTSTHGCSLVNISTLAARQILNVFYRLLLAFIFHSIKVLFPLLFCRARARFRLRTKCRVAWPLKWDGKTHRRAPTSCACPENVPKRREKRAASGEAHEECEERRAECERMKLYNTDGIRGHCRTKKTKKNTLMIKLFLLVSCMDTLDG